MFIIDGAHNLEGAKILVDTFLKYFPNRRILFIVGVLKDKDYKSLIKSMLPIAYRIITITPNSDRALDGIELANFIRQYNKNVSYAITVEDAISKSIKEAE